MKSSMNRAFKVIFNKSTGTYVAVSELAKSGGKSSKSVVALAVVTSLLMVGGEAFAGPIGGVVTNGVAQINKNSNTTTINQSSDKAIINWQGFDVSKSETVQFNQKNVNSVILNRVLSATPSMIDGAINANGKVFIVNAAGIIVGKNANINVGGLALSALGISNSDFMAGNYKFSGQAPANITNEGNITATAGGFVAMIGGQVNNSGVIVAKEGMVALASGSAATLTIGEGVTSHTLVVDSGTVDALINVGGAIRVDGGQIVLSAHAVNSLLHNIINQTGILEANSMTSVGGKIVIDGGSNGIVNLAGTINAQGQTGGTVIASGDEVLFTGQISATGINNGGNVYIGGGSEGKDTNIINANNVAMTKSASIDVSSTNNGNGGNAVLWSEGSTQFTGDIKAKGGINGGNGGYIETSGHTLGFNGTVNVDSEKGTPGLILLDPDIIIIQSTATGTAGAQDASLPTITATTSDAIGSTSTVSVAALEAITSGTISLQANGYIQVQDLTQNGNNGEINLKPNVNLKLATFSNGGSSLPALPGYSVAGYGGIEFVNSANGITASGTGTVTLTGGNSTAPGSPSVNSNAQTINIGHISTDSGAITLQGADGLAVLGNLTTKTGNITLDGDSDQGGVGFLNVTSNFKTNSGAVLLKGGYTSSSGVSIVGNVDVGTGTLNFGATSSSTFQGAYSILGSITALGNFTIAQPVTLGGTATIQTTGQLGFGAAVNVKAASNLTLTANSYSIAQAINGNGANITLKPASVTDNLQLGIGGTGTNVAPVLTKLSNFGNVTIGGSDLRGKVTVSGSNTIVGNLTIEAGGAGGQIDIQDGTNLTTNKNIIINADSSITTDGAAHFTSTGGKVSLVTPGNLNLTASTVLKSTSFVELSIGGTFTNPAGLSLIDSSTPYWRLYVPQASDLTGTGFTTSTGFHRYGCTLAAGCATTTTVPTSGDGILFANIPLLDLSTVSGSTDYGTSLGNGFGTSLSYAGLINGDTISNANVSGSGSAVFSTTPAKSTSNNVNAGTYNIQADKGTLVSAMGYGFTASPSSATLTITPKTVTTTYTANNKIYDGTAIATGTTTVAGLISGDVVNGTSVASFSDKNVGNNKNVTGTNGLSGTDSGNYVISNASSPISTQANITQKNVNFVLGTTTKTYDAFTNAGSVASSSDLISTDNVIVSTNATYDNKNVGTGKIVSATVALSGSDASNYNIVSNSVSGTGDITAKTLIATMGTSSKVYDGGTTGTISSLSLSGMVNGEGMSAGFSSPIYDNKNAGTGKTATSNVTLMGSTASNYTIAPTVSDTNATITPKQVNTTTSVSSKTYDGGTLATTTTSSTDIFNSDSVSLSSSGTFSDKNVGVSKVVSINTTLTGTDANNYQLVTPTSSGNADINKKTVTATLSATDKTYDGGTLASATSSLSGFILTDDISSVVSSANFSDKNVGNNKNVIATLALAGNDSGNYDLSSTATTTAAINKKVITTTLSALDKTYDGGTLATATSSSTGFVSGDDISATVSNANFSDKNVGLNKNITATVALAGNDSGNYDLSSTAATTTATINKLVLTSPTASSSNKTYDGGTVAIATLGAVTGVVSGDDLNVFISNANFSDKNVGLSKNVVVNLSTTGADVGNYDLSNFAVNTNADISKKVLSNPTLTVSNKTYDGSTLASASLGALTGVVSGDDLSASVTSSNFSDKNAAINKNVTSTLALGGADLGNYSLSNPTTTNVATINSKVLTSPTATVDTKTYDGNTVAKANLGQVQGVVSGDNLNIGITNANFSDKNAGLNKSVSIVLNTSGTDSGNYQLANNTINSTGDIAKKGLTYNITGNGQKTYTVGKDTAPIGFQSSLNNTVAGDNIAVANLNFISNNAPVTPAVSGLYGIGVNLSGLDSNNYFINYPASQPGAPVTFLSLNTPLSSIAQVNAGQDVSYDQAYAKGKTFDSKGKNLASTADNNQPEFLKVQKESVSGNNGTSQNLRFNDPAIIKDVTNEVVVSK